ncbi:MAG: hypothetical protein ACXWD8_05090 [Mycobacterium sp.]
MTQTLEFGLVGALVHASCGIDNFQETDEMARMAATVLPDGR